MTFLTGLIKAGYFADGRRAWKYSTYFLYDGNTLLAELDGNGNVQTAYGTGAAGLVQRWIPGNSGGTTYGYTFDPSGNLVQRTSTTNLVNNIYADFTTYYDAYGAQLHQIDPGSGSSFQGVDAVGFGGQWGYYMDNATSPPAPQGQMPVMRTPICLLGARYYDPSVGRFLTRDPVGYESGPNVYAYAHNNPIMAIDPSGTDSLLTSIVHLGLDVAGGAAGGAAMAVNPLLGAAIGTALVDGLWAYIVEGKSMSESAVIAMKSGILTYVGGRVITWVASKLLASPKVMSALECLSPKARGMAMGFLRGLSGAAEGSCFVAGTLVSMADGSLRPIESICGGDRVVSRDPATGQTEIKRVARTFQRTAYEIVKLALANSTTGKVVDSLRGTPKHPFFTPTGVVAMGELKPEMRVITRRGPPLMVKPVTHEPHPEGIAVYNFEVEGDHTYFVGKA